MSRVIDELTASTQGFPRVSGDEPVDDQCILGNVGFSPRERG